MSAYDLVAAAVIAISALMGYQRGAVREIVGLVAFGVSAVAALALLPVSVKVAGGVFHPHIVAVAAAVVAGFAVVYLGLKLLGQAIATSMHKQALLGGADRSLGLFIGAVRALVLIGLFTLVFDRATPETLKPRWVTDAFLYPLGQASARAIAAVAPVGMKMLTSPRSLPDAQNTPNDRSVAGSEDGRPPAPKPSARKGKGYDKASRDRLDRLVEQTR